MSLLAIVEVGTRDFTAVATRASRSWVTSPPLGVFINPTVPLSILPVCNPKVTVKQGQLLNQQGFS